MKLEELHIYNLAMEVGERIWKVTKEWSYFNKSTIGSQVIKSADSIAANISEGFGRYHYKDAKNFYYYSRGSVFETKTWLQKMFNRKLISEKNYKELLKDLDILGALLNKYINSTGSVKTCTASQNE